MKRELSYTKDQSATLFVPELDEHYHSVHGALQESRHVFIEAGLKQFPGQADLHILEIGFGTGLNALLSYAENISRKQNITYWGLEKYPLQREEWQSLNYLEQIGADETLNSIFEQMHQCLWEEEQKLGESFKLKKVKVDFLEASLPDNTFDLIYFDAFAPSAQPELWEHGLFRKIYNSMKPKAMLVTYCVKGSARRAMQAAGFAVEKIPGPPGKREMARAIKPEI
jgi:tRNA U34 5-methylaminomethyl-2-thiouridine-forming methyltransferase MnmC